MKTEQREELNELLKIGEISQEEYEQFIKEKRMLGTYPLTEETKNKISESMMKHSISEETRRKISETLKEKYRLGLKDKHNSGTFKKGRLLPPEIEKKRDENAKLSNTGSAHYAWKGGTHATAKRIVIRAGIDMTQCRICKDSLIGKRAIIHHCDGNEYNNNLFNLAVLCDFCHNAIHDTPSKRANRFQVGHDVPQDWRNKISIANSGGSLI